jgi:hypothetical protein
VPQGPDDATGPSLKEYVETRFNLLNEGLKQTERGFVIALDQLKAGMRDAQEGTDLRYQQRFDAQSKALEAAFLSQQTAMQTAFTVAEKAVQAALAAADRAVSKAELAADKRFEALNELRQMLNDMVATLITRQEAVQRFDSVAEKIEASVHRVEGIEARINRMTGDKEGSRENRGDTRADTTKTLQMVGTFLTIVGLLVVLWKLSVGR